jgi:hypothetical protein
MSDGARDKVQQPYGSADSRSTAAICAGGDRYVASRDKRALEAEAICCGFHPHDFLIDATQCHKKSSSRTTHDFSVTVWNLRNNRVATYVGGPGRAWLSVFFKDLVAGHFGTPSMSQAANYVQTNH